MSARPAGEPWQSTVRIELDQENARGSYRCGGLTLPVTILEPVSTPAPATSPFPDQFELRPGTDSWNYLTAAVAFPVRFARTMYLYSWADPLGGVPNCHNNYPIVPEEGGWL